MKKTLTIGIPTYNRHPELVYLIEHIIKNGLNKQVEVLVFDDGSVCSSDNSSYFASIEKHKNIRYISRNQNCGFASSLLFLFKECRTDYLMLLADDNIVIETGISDLFDYIQSNNPDFLSSICLSSGGKLLKGGNKCASIKPEEFFGASAHAPGLIFNCSSCTEAISFLEERLFQKCEAALVYPQVILLAYLLIQKRECLWYPSPIVVEYHNLPSGITDSTGSKYTSLESRWRQLKSFDDLFQKLQNTENSEISTRLRKANENRVFGQIVIAMESENLNLRKAFDQAAIIYYLKQALINCTFGLFKRIK